MEIHLPPLKPEVLVPKIGDYLVEKGLISRDDLRAALLYQQSLRSKTEFPPLLGEILVQQGKLNENQLDQAITEQIIQLRKILEKTNQRLEQRVKERTSELENALSKLEELNKVKTNFVATISHELRTPLTHIKGYVELLFSNDLGSLNESQMEAVSVMRTATSRLEGLIEDMILFSTSEKEQINLIIEPFDITTVIKKVTNRVQNRVKENKIQLVIDLPAVIPDVKADQEKIYWVILQLVDNAIKFTPPGGKILIKCKIDDSVMRVSVIDTGIGIPAEKINEIFEPFHQLDNSSTRRYSGTGLGLALAKRIIEAHGSHIFLTTKENKGSAFEFLLNTVLIKKG